MRISRTVIRYLVLWIGAMAITLPGGCFGGSTERFFAEESPNVAIDFTVKENFCDGRAAKFFTDVSLTVRNNLSDTTIEQLAAEIMFSDPEGNQLWWSPDRHASHIYFTLAMSSGNNDKATPLAPVRSREFFWCFIPTLRTALQHLQSPGIYTVGARVTYSIDGRFVIRELPPQVISVPPTPQLLRTYAVDRRTKSFEEDSEKNEVLLPRSSEEQFITALAGNGMVKKLSRFDESFFPEAGDVLILKHSNGQFVVAQAENIVLKEPLQVFSSGNYIRVRDFCINNCPIEIWEPQIYIIYSLSNDTYSSLEQAKAEAELLELGGAAESYCLTFTQFLETYEVMWKGKISERHERH